MRNARTSTPCLIVIMLLMPFYSPMSAIAEETYVVERLWPNYQHPWFFYHPQGVAVDNIGNVYIVDAGNNRVRKFNSNGALITQWGKYGEGDGQFYAPGWVATDCNGNVYVTDGGRIQKFSENGKFILDWAISVNGEPCMLGGIATDCDGHVLVVDLTNYRIQKFTSTGVFLARWGRHGSAKGEFDWETLGSGASIATDEEGSVYVVDSGNYRIQKFDSDGIFISEWGSYGSLNGQFTAPLGICIDAAGNVYVSNLSTEDSPGPHIQKFDRDGMFIARWGEYGAKAGQFFDPYGMAVDANGNLYVADILGNRIQKFTIDGVFVAKWGTEGQGENEFFLPRGIATDRSGNLYITDSGNNRIQKVGPDGKFLKEWGNPGGESGEFFEPHGVVLDDSNNVYVTDWDNNRIQIFTADGAFLGKWGSRGLGDGEFSWPDGITSDFDGNIYVTDAYSHRVQKFTWNGKFIRKWGSYGSEYGNFIFPDGIAANSGGNIYIADSGNGRIQQFSSNGTFLRSWGTDNESISGRLQSPRGVAIDSQGNVYVVDAYLNCIFKFSANGEFLTQIGEAGTEQGQLSGPEDLCVDKEGRVYVADTANNRIQVFSTAATPSPGQKISKAIILAGGGTFSGNNLWEATEMCANYAYRALTYQGYSKENLYYLSADTGLDLDGNGILDDVDANATNANLQYAIQNWARDADELFIYMVDHGGNGTFRMGATEILYAQDLDAWLDNLQQTLEGPLTMVYDACESGSFLPHLIPPSGKQRILAASASPGEESIFVGNGTVSFSFLFWGHMFNGERFYDAFVGAKKSVSTTYNQTALLDANGNGIGNEKADKDLASLIRIGNETKSAGDVPVIGSVSPHQDLENTSSALICADQVVDADGISRVWAVITPPGYSPGSIETPVTDLPTIDLPSVGNNRFETVYTQFTSSGTYNIAVFALDRKGVLSLPVQTSVTHNTACLTVGNDLGIRVPCAEFNGSRYSFLLDFYRHTDDPSGFYWKLVMGSLSTGEGNNCIPIGADLTMPVPCVCHNGVRYGFMLHYYQNPFDPSSLYWRMDKNTLVVK